MTIAPLIHPMTELGYSAYASVMGYPMEFWHPKSRVAIEVYQGRKASSVNRDAAFRANGIIVRKFPASFALGDITGFVARAKNLRDKHYST